MTEYTLALLDRLGKSVSSTLGEIYRRKALKKTLEEIASLGEPNLFDKEGKLNLNEYQRYVGRLIDIASTYPDVPEVASVVNSYIGGIGNILSARANEAEVELTKKRTGLTEAETKRTEATTEAIKQETEAKKMFLPIEMERMKEELERLRMANDITKGTMASLIGATNAQNTFLQRYFELRGKPENVKRLVDLELTPTDLISSFLKTNIIPLDRAIELQQKIWNDYHNYVAQTLRQKIGDNKDSTILEYTPQIKSIVVNTYNIKREHPELVEYAARNDKTLFEVLTNDSDLEKALGGKDKVKEFKIKYSGFYNIENEPLKKYKGQISQALGELVNEYEKALNLSMLLEETSPLGFSLSYIYGSKVGRLPYIPKPSGGTSGFDKSRAKDIFGK